MLLLGGPSLFWANRACIEQHDELDRDLRMQAMDVVYHTSPHPPALPSTT